MTIPLIILQSKHKILRYYGNHIPAISSFDNKHLIKHGVKNSHIIKEKVQSLTIKNLLENII